MSLGTPEIIIIVILILVLFGPDKLPGLARNVGKGIREFRKITGEFQNHLNLAGDDDDDHHRPQRHASSDSPYADRDEASDDYNYHAPDTSGRDAADRQNAAPQRSKITQILGKRGE